MLNCFKDYKRYIHIFNHILCLTWPKSMKLTLKPQNNPANALATLGTSASASMVLTPKAGLFRLQHQKSWVLITEYRPCSYILVV